MAASMALSLSTATPPAPPPPTAATAAVPLLLAMMELLLPSMTDWGVGTWEIREGGEEEREREREEETEGEGEGERKRKYIYCSMVLQEGEIRHSYMYSSVILYMYMQVHEILTRGKFNQKRENSVYMYLHVLHCLECES